MREFEYYVVHHQDACKSFVALMAPYFSQFGARD